MKPLVSASSIFFAMMMYYLFLRLSFSGGAQSGGDETPVERADVY
jgi:hypothetical protein